MPHNNLPYADEIRHWVHYLRLRLILISRSPLIRKLQHSEAARQLLPLFVVIVIPALALFAASSAQGLVYRLFSKLAMVLDSISSFFWGSSSSSGLDEDKGLRGKRKKDKKDKEKKAPRTRAEQLQMNGLKRSKKQQGENDEDEDDEGYYPGLVNVSGTYCFMNSTLQALASLSYLQPQIDAIHAKAEALDVPTPVIDTLKELFEDLNTPRSAYRAIRPMNIISVLSSTTQNRVNSLFNSREHQDAQELFQVVSEALKNELAAVDKEGLRDRGFGGFASGGETMTKEIGKTVFDGLTANRRSCVVCGYTEAVMHFAFDNWQLSVPRMAAQCRLEDCLEDYTRLETLRDCICRKCSLVATRLRLQSELATLEEACKPVDPADPNAKPPPSKSKQRRLKEVRKMEAKVKQALDEGRIEDDLPDVRIEKVVSPMSTKQAMIARPPPVLALHLNRSIHYGSYAGKNNVRISFPEILDLTPYTTSGSLSTHPTQSISTPPPPSTSLSSSTSTTSSSTGTSSTPFKYMRSRSSTPTPSLYHQEAERTIYRLSSIVCHFGGHSFGHYICFRRKPRREKLDKEERWRPPTLIDPLRLTPSFEDDSPGNSTTLGGGEPGANGVAPRGAPEEGEGEEDEYPFDDTPPQPGKGWLRISDDSVREVGLESVLAEGTGVFMLYYERAVHPRPGIYSGHTSVSPDSGNRTIRGRGKGMESEETLKPDAKVKRIELNGSAASLVSEVGVLTSKKSGISLSMDNVKNEGGGVDNLKQAESRANLTRSMSFEPRIIRSVEAGRGKRSVSVQPVLASAVTSQSRDLDAAPKDSGGPSMANGSAAPSPSSNLAPKIPKSPLTATMNGAPVLSSHSPLPTLAETPSAAAPSGPLSSSKPPPKSPSKRGKKAAKAGPPLVSPVVHVGEPEP